MFLSILRFSASNILKMLLNVMLLLGRLRVVPIKSRKAIENPSWILDRSLDDPPEEK